MMIFVKILLAFAICVIIAAVAKLVFFKKNSNKIQKVTDSDKSQMEDTILQPESHSDTIIENTSIVHEQPSSAALLQKAQSLIGDQRYDDAVAELKRALIISPDDSNIILKLMQVYGITKQYDAFNTLHQKIHTLGNHANIADADFLKSLIDDSITEQSAIAKKQEEAKRQSTYVPDKPLEFILDDEDDNTIAEAKPQSNQNQTDISSNLHFVEPATDSVDADEAGFELSFDDDFDFSENSNEEINQKEQEETIASSDSSIFDELMLDDISPNESHLTAPSTEATEDIQPAPSFDELALDETTLSHDDDESFSFEDIDFDGTQVAQEASQQPDSAHSFSFDDIALDEPVFDEPIFADAKDTNLENSTSGSDDVIGFDFEDISLDNTENHTDTDSSILDFDLDEAQDTQKDTAVDNAIFEDTFSFDDLKLDSSASDHTSNETTSGGTVQQESFDNNLTLSDFNLDAIDVKSDDNSNFDIVVDQEFTDQKESNHLTETAFDFDDATAVKEDSFIFDTADNSSTPQNPSVDLNVDSATTTGFDFITQLDDAQITLDLANQYLSLGEHDSARRLLQEVIDSGNSEQQHQATKLLQHIG